MTLETRRLHPRVGVEILGVDVTKVSEAVFGDIVVPDAPVAPAREIDIVWGRAQLAAV